MRLLPPNLAHNHNKRRKNTRPPPTFLLSYTAYLRNSFHKALGLLTGNTVTTLSHFFKTLVYFNVTTHILIFSCATITKAFAPVVQSGGFTLPV